MRPLYRVTYLAIALAASAMSFSGALAQSRPAIVISRIASAKSCTIYQESAGQSAMVATPYMIAATESWRTWLVKDCVDNFATIRTSLEAALASSGKFTVKTAGSGYSLSGAISDVGEDGGSASGGGYAVASRRMFVNMDFTLRDPAGRMVYGGPLTKHLEIGSRIRTEGMSTSSGQSGEGVYTEIQHEVALAVARLVAFHVIPLQVTGADGRQIQLNYGSPLLTLGTIVHVASPDGSMPVRYNVTSASPDGATAEVDGEVGDWRKITPGSTASVVEADDPSATERRIPKTDLP